MNDFDTMLRKLYAGEVFSWSRWGDGEFNCILNVDGQNCDGHKYFPDLGTALKAVLESKPNYFLGLQELGRNIWKGNPEFDRLIALNTWGSSEILHHASAAGRLQEFFEFIEENVTVIIVGNDTLMGLPFSFIPVPVPMVNCWESYQSVLAEIESVVDPGSVVLYSAGMMSKVLIHALRGRGITQIDTGSVFDPYVGRNTRQYHNLLKLGD